MRALGPAALAAALIVLTSCGGGGTDPEAVPAAITLSATNVTLNSLNATFDLDANVQDAGGATISVNVSWSSTTPAVATVTNQGVVTAISNGTAKVIAAAGTVQDTADVTVQQVAATLTLSPDTMRFASAGDTATIGRTVRDAGGSPMSGVAVTFATVNPSVATVVVATGKVTAAANGATNVTGQVAPGGPALTKSIRVEVGGALPPAYLVGGNVGIAYNDQVGPATGAGGAFSYSVTAGALPPGLGINASNGTISGTPAGGSAAVHFFEVTATNGTLTLSERYAITISTKAASAFNLWVTYNGGAMPPLNARTAVSAAVARMEQIVTGEFADVTYPPSGLNSTGPGSCQLVNASLMNGAFIDDVAILMALGPIDGPSNTLARGGFCGYGRTPAPPATITGQMLLDEVDAAGAPGTGASYQDVIWHEMAHALGIGTLWQSMTTGTGTPNVFYNGTNGKAEWTTLRGATPGPTDVPLEPDIGAHWHEAYFDSEIMTPTTEGPSTRLPISRMTIATLMDLGWGVAIGAADAYTLPGCSSTASCSIIAGVGAPTEGGAGRVPDFVIERLLPLP